MIAAINTSIYAVMMRETIHALQEYRLVDCCTNELRQLKCMLKPLVIMCCKSLAMQI